MAHAPRPKNKKKIISAAITRPEYKLILFILTSVLAAGWSAHARDPRCNSIPSEYTNLNVSNMQSCRGGCNRSVFGGLRDNSNNLSECLDFCGKVERPSFKRAFLTHCGFKVEGAGSGSAPPATCKGTQAGCQDSAGVASDIGAGESTRAAEDMNTAASDAEKLRANNIEATNQYMDQWKVRQAQSNLPNEQQKYQHDRALVDKATQAYLDNKSISPEEAKTASDPAVRESLEMESRNKVFSDAFQSSAEHYQMQAREFSGQSEENKKRSKSLTAFSEDGSADLSAQATTAENASIAGKKAKSLDGKKDKKETNGDTSNLAANGGKDGNLKTALQKSLRDRLAAMDKKSRDLAATGAENFFNGEMQYGSAGENKPYAKKSGFETAIDMAKNLQNDFSLDGPENDRVLSSLVGELTDEQAGILGQESLSLFERVHQIHVDYQGKGQLGAPHSVKKSQ